MAEPCNPKEPISGWTFETLKYHLGTLLDERRGQFMSILEERDRRHEERFTTQQQEVIRLATQYQLDRASANEWRGALNDNTTKMMPRVEWDIAHRSIIEKFEAEAKALHVQLNTINERLITIESRQGFMSVSLTLSICSLLLALAVAIIGSLHLYTR